MINLPQDVLALARRLAVAQRLPVEEAVRQAIEDKARAAGVFDPPAPTRRRSSVAEMLAAGDEISAMPLLDQRSPREIMDDLNAL